MSKYEYQTIDKNWTKNPCALCKRYHKALTPKLMKTHKCMSRLKGQPCDKLERWYKFE